MLLKPALCLDFDGTIRYGKNDTFINKPEDIALFEGVEEKIWEYRNNGYLIFGITNQGGVAYGYKTVEEDRLILARMIDLFIDNPFFEIITCYAHPNGGVEPYNHRSLLRKPEIGMLVSAEREAFAQGYVVDWDNSLFVGDREEDKLCAKNAGIEFKWADEWRNT